MTSGKPYQTRGIVYDGYRCSPSGRTYLKRGLEPTYLIYARSPDGSEELMGSFFTLEEAKLRVRLLAQKSGRGHYLYDSLKREVIEEKLTSRPARS